MTKEEEAKTITQLFTEAFGESALEELVAGLGRHWDEAFTVKDASRDAKVLCALQELYAWECATKCKHRPRLTEEQIRGFLTSPQLLAAWGSVQVPQVGIHAWKAGRFKFLE